MSKSCLFILFRLNVLFTLLWGLNSVASAEPVAPSPKPAAELKVLPAVIPLYGKEARQQLLLEQTIEGEFVGHIDEKITWKSSNEKVVVIRDGVALPKGDGEATISATHDGKTALTRVTVTDFAKPFHWEFRNHVESVFSKKGCNSGACHGAQAGKHGFKLSLFAYDPIADFNVITRSDRGRRIVPSDPGRSLILTKPSGAIAHKGGFKFDSDSLEYRVVAEWIAAGARPPTEADRRVQRLEVLPKMARLKKGGSQKLLVRAYFSDGRSEDVTRWVKFVSANETVAQVNGQGKVTISGNGQAAISAWYLNKIVMADIISPYENKLGPQVFKTAPQRNLIDRRNLAKLKLLKIAPSARCSDGNFLRRVCLDTIGVLPTVEQTRHFLADKSPDRRDRLIDRLLSRPEYIDYWSYQWSDLLLVNSSQLNPAAVKSYYGWIRKNVARDTPWDKMVRDLITAQGSTLKNGAANFYVLHQNPTDLSETVSQAFLGMGITCAKCHNHPLEKWTNDQFYGMANLFARVRTKNTGAAGDLTVYSVSKGELLQPKTGKPQPPRPLDAEPIAANSNRDRREYLAEWLTSPKNPYFARSITNRVWANFMGVGLVERVDDLRMTNPASNEALLSDLAKFLIDNKFDIKSLVRLILQSETYQRRSQPLPENREDNTHYSHYYPRRLMAEVLLDAISSATGVPSTFKGYPAGTRALQLRDASVDSYFLKTFGRPDRVITCTCERTSEPSMVQVLHISNGETINGKLAAKNNRIANWQSAKLTNYQMIERAYLAALCRYPTDQEMALLLAELNKTSGAERRIAIEDLFWGILSSKQFLFNH